jgi:hypothetical protein
VSFCRFVNYFCLIVILFKFCVVSFLTVCLQASDEDDLTRNSLFLRIDRTYLVPFFTRLRPRTRVDESPNDADIDEFELVKWRSAKQGEQDSVMM